MLEYGEIMYLQCGCGTEQIHPYRGSFMKLISIWLKGQ